MNHSIIVRSDLEVSILPDAYQLRDQAITQSALIGKVDDEASKQVAYDAQTALKECVDACERSRKVIKKPFLDGGRNVDAIADDYSSQAKCELMRLSLLIGNYEALQLAKLRAAQKSQANELSELEKQKWADIAKATSHEEIDEITYQYAQKQAELQSQLPVIQRLDNQRVTEDWEVEVTNIHALYLAQPTCVKLEPKLFEIKALLKSGITPPGITATKVTKSGVKK